MELQGKKLVLVGGDFTLLWHNSQFEQQQERMLYEQICWHPLHRID